MGPASQKISDLEKKMYELDEAILTYNRTIEELKSQRYELLAQKQSWELQEVFEYAVENDITAEEIMKILLNALKQKNCAQQTLQHLQ